MSAEYSIDSTASVYVYKGGDWYVAQALEVDVASQGETADDALANLREALELHFEPPLPTSTPPLRQIEVEVGYPEGTLTHTYTHR